MSQDVTASGLGAKQRAAVALLADGKLGDAEVAERVGVVRETIVRWRRLPAFAAAVAALVARASAAAEAAAIGNKTARLASYQDDWDAIQAVIAARARQYADVPGGETGLLVAKPVLVKVYEGEGEEIEGALTPLKRARVILSYEVDVALLRERRELRKQMAIEQRQWVERKEQTNREGAGANLDLAQLTDDELAELERLTAKAASTKAGDVT